MELDGGKDQVRDKVFLQALLSHGALHEEQIKLLHQKSASVCEVSAGEESLSEYVSMLNKRLELLGLKVGRALMEDSYQHWYALVNSTPDAAAKVGSKFTPPQLEFFNKIVKLVVQEEGIVSSSQLLNVTCELARKISADDAQTFIKSLIKHHWLEEVAGKLSAGPRFILELRPFLSEIYGESVPQCKMCNEPVIRGQQCGTCDVKIHLLCVAMLAGSRSEIHCPDCNARWPHDIPDIMISEAAPSNKGAPRAASNMGGAQEKRPRRH